MRATAEGSSGTTKQRTRKAQIAAEQQTGIGGSKTGRSNGEEGGEGMERRAHIVEGVIAHQAPAARCAGRTTRLSKGPTAFIRGPGLLGIEPLLCLFFAVPDLPFFCIFPPSSSCPSSPFPREQRRSIPEDERRLFERNQSQPKLKTHLCVHPNHLLCQGAFLGSLLLPDTLTAHAPQRWRTDADGRHAFWSGTSSPTCFHGWPTSLDTHPGIECAWPWWVGLAGKTSTMHRRTGRRWGSVGLGSRPLATCRRKKQRLLPSLHHRAPCSGFHSTEWPYKESNGQMPT